MISCIKVSNFIFILVFAIIPRGEECNAFLLSCPNSNLRPQSCCCWWTAIPQLSPPAPTMMIMSESDSLGSKVRTFKNIPSKKGTYKRLTNVSKAWGATYRQVRSIAKMIFLVIFSYHLGQRGFMERKIIAAIMAAVVANITCNKIVEKTTIMGRCKILIKKNKGHAKEAKTLSVWDDDERIQKALEKSKRSKTWIDQSIMKIEETNRRISDEKAQQEALREAQRKKMAKEWVVATMRSQSIAIEEAQRKKAEEERANLRAKKWAESMIRNTGIDL